MSIEYASRAEGRMIYIVITLLILHLTLISAQVEDPSGTLLLKKWLLTAGAPILNGSSMVSRGIRNLWTGYIWFHGTRAENDRLQENVRQLSLRNYHLEEARLENQRLKRLLDFSSSLPYQALGAHVIGRAPSYLSNTIYVDRGSASGVRRDLAVVSDAGVLGRTVLVAGGSCQVQLIANADASVGVMIERTRSPGVLRGTENLLLDLKYVSNTEDVNVDDVIITSGLDGIFPKGLPVGKVVDSQKGKTGFRDIKVAPSADLIRIEEVLILLPAPGLGAEQPAPGAGK